MNEHYQIKPITMSLRSSILFSLFWLCLQVESQISIVNVNVQAFNIVPEALLNVGIMNHESQQSVQVLTQIVGSSGNVLLTVKSQPFVIARGLNPGLSGSRKIALSEYGSSAQANYLKTALNLPSGRYKVCSSILSASADKLDDLCDELEAEFNQYLYLVNPFNNDTIEGKNPVLSWTHSEAFALLNQGEFYRMVLTEMKKEQTAEEAITVNTPLMVKNYLKEHQLQYPYDARELKEGSRYAWQVQKISDGVIINKTEAWSFNTRSAASEVAMRYVRLKSSLDGSFYTAVNGQVYFTFSEEYKSQGDLRFVLLDAKSAPVNIDIVNDKSSKENKGATQLKSIGDNRYDMDLDAGKLKKGFYTLIVKNEKNESFYLKIFLP
jgi:hypothetical protein